MKRDLSTNADMIEKQLHKANGKSDGDVIKNVYDFFKSIYIQTYARDDKERSAQKSKGFEEDLLYLDENTSVALKMDCNEVVEHYTLEDICQIEENDPGYVNGYVLDCDNELACKENTYIETGLHEGAIKWGDYATKESVKYVMLEKGHIVSRWGSEAGCFVSDVDVEYELLQMPVVQEKKVNTLYEVVKPFPVEISEIKVQPWNLNGSVDDKMEEKTIQYKTPIEIKELLLRGYLKNVTK